MDTDGKRSAPPPPLGVQSSSENKTPTHGAGAVRPLRPPLKLPTSAKTVQAPPRPPALTATRPSVPSIRKKGSESPTALQVPGIGSLARPGMPQAMHTAEAVPIAATGPALHAKLPAALNPPNPRLSVPRLHSLTKGASLPRPGAINIGRTSSGGSTLASPMSSTSGSRPVARSAADVLHPRSPSNSSSVGGPYPPHSVAAARAPASPSSTSGSVAELTERSMHSKVQVKAPIPVSIQPSAERLPTSTAHRDASANGSHHAAAVGTRVAGAASVPGVRPNTNLVKKAPVPAPHAGVTQSESKKQDNTISPVPGTLPAPDRAASSVHVPESTAVPAEGSSSTMTTAEAPAASNKHVQAPSAVADNIHTQVEGSTSSRSVQPSSQSGWVAMQGGSSNSTGSGQNNEPPSTSEAQEASTSTWGTEVAGQGLQEPRAGSGGLQSPGQGVTGTGTFDYLGHTAEGAVADSTTSASQQVPEPVPVAMHRPTHSQATTHSFFDDLAAPSRAAEDYGAKIQAYELYDTGGWGQGGAHAHALNHEPPAPDVQSSWAPCGQDAYDPAGSAASDAAGHAAGASGSFFDQWQQEAPGYGGEATPAGAGDVASPTHQGADVHGSSALSQHYTSEVPSAFDHSSSAEGGYGVAQPGAHALQQGNAQAEQPYAQSTDYTQHHTHSAYQGNVEQHHVTGDSYYASQSQEQGQQGEPYWYEEWGCWVSACHQYYYDDASASWLAIPQQETGDAASYGVSAEATAGSLGVGASASQASIHAQPQDSDAGANNHLAPLELPQSNVQAPGSADTALQQYGHEQRAAGNLGSPSANGASVQPHLGYRQQQQQQQYYPPTVPVSNPALPQHTGSSSTLLPQPPQSSQYGVTPASGKPEKYVPAAPATQQPSFEAPRSVRDAMHMNSGRPPHSFLAFGVGGRCCLCKHPDPYTSYASNLLQTQSVSAFITDVASLTKALKQPLDSFANVDSVASARSVSSSKKDSSRPSSHRGKDSAAHAVFRDWPGPMAMSSPSSKSIAAAVEVRARLCSTEGRAAQALIWRLLGTMAKHKGAVVDTAAKGAQPEAEVVQLLTEDLDNVGSSSSSAEAAASMINSWVAHDTSLMTVRRIEDLVVSGKRSDALEAAKQARLWPLAVVIARFIGGDVYRDTVRAMLDCGLQQGSVLHMFSLLATSSHDQVASSLQDPAATATDTATSSAPDSTLTQPGGPTAMYQAGAVHAPNPTVFTPSIPRTGALHTSPAGPLNQLNGLQGQQQLQTSHQSGAAPAPLTWSPSTETWPRTLIMMAANRTAGDSSALTGFGHHLWTLDALQCVELLAWCQSQFQPMPMYWLAPRYLQYAGQLAEAGLIADAVAYANAAMQLLGKAKADRAAVLSFNVDAVLAAATDWHMRLKAHGAATGASHVRSGQSVVSRFGSFLDRTVMNMLGAADVNPNPAGSSPTPGLSKSGSAASLASSRAAPLLHPGRGGSWGGNEMRRGVTVPDMSSAAHTAMPLQPLQMHSTSNASSPRARSASCAPSAAGVSQSASPHSVNNTSMSPPVPGPPGLVGGPQGRALGSGATSRHVSSWSGVPGPVEGDQRHGVPINGHRRQLSESALGGGSPSSRGHSRSGSVAASETRTSTSKGWLGGIAARILPGSSSKENVTGPGNGSDSDFSHSAGKPPVAPAHPPAQQPVQQSYAYSGLAPPPSFGAWGDAGAAHSAPQIPPSHACAPLWGAQPTQAHNNSGQQWPAHQPAQSGSQGSALGGSMSHHAPQLSASGNFFSQPAPTTAGYVQPSAPSTGTVRPQVPMYGSNVRGNQQYRQWNAGGPPAGPQY